MGIFSTWVLWEDAGAAFERILAKNRHYPFDQWDEDHYTFSVRYFRFYVSLVVMALSIGVFALWLLLENMSQYVIYPAAMILISGVIAFMYKNKREYTLNLITKQYTFTENASNATVGHLHNIYVRLRMRKGSSGYPHYFLVLNGYGMDTVNLTSTSKDISVMRNLGKELAANLRINYFDERNVSRFHVVRHPRPLPGVGGAYQTVDVELEALPEEARSAAGTVAVAPSQSNRSNSNSE